MHYNTTHLVGDALTKKQDKAKSQEEIILDFFKKNPDEYYTCWDVQASVPALRKTPITSIRRAITDLSKVKFPGEFKPLVKTAHTKPGAFNDPCYCFKLNIPTLFD